ncbi:IclR family transcriptional regulator [Noviherbaspirillum saxi]|uniref:IclR family transcriptional regulator n=1 Tax=Noviherbaspirillum saxi TaxID=2320863 RepID=A0A3A3FL55_9BURK|nr:IclR family transcriptional regulator [Noviherbaspirillum saxi]RJF92242.1 IclR family transcriptional regulator [Noviherbaspirillum saxi]
MRPSKKNLSSDSTPEDSLQEDSKGGPVSRAFRVLRYVVEGGSTANLSDLARQVEINRITATRLLATLEQEGMLERLPQGGHRIGIGFLSLAATSLASGDMFGHGRRLLARLSKELQLSAYLVVPDGAYVLYVLRETPQTPLVSNIQPGSRIPAHLMTPGRVLIAQQPSESWAAMLEATRDDERSRKITLAGLETMLKEDRERGCAWSFSGFESGIDACAAPVFDAHGQAVAAISVAGPDSRFEGDPDFKDQTEQAVKAAAAQLSQLLGYVGR